MQTEELTLMPEEQARRDEEMVQGAFRKLLDTYKASPHNGDIDIIIRAFNFARNAHVNARRKSGEPYIMHPIAVAQILCEEMGLGSTSICAALLHDVVEDTIYKQDDMTRLFGPVISRIVSGVTKIKEEEAKHTDGTTQVASLNKTFTTSVDDPRVLLVKLADRLHNLRTLDSMPENKQLRTTGETMMFYAPIAERLGLNKVKSELEDLSFRYEHPVEYRQIVEAVSVHRKELEDIVKSFMPPIEAKLQSMGYKYRIIKRIKTPYSIWKKVKDQGLILKSINDNVYDILAIRIIFTPKNEKAQAEEIFHIYGALTRIYRPHPSRFRDWVANPKSNGYRALHSTFMSTQGRWVEVQLRSEEMDEIAEIGLAAHWKYKGHDEASVSVGSEKWLNDVRSIVSNPTSSGVAMLDNFKLSLYSQEIIVYTPKGDLYTLPKGATVLDFAYEIHTTLGNHCAGGKIDHKLVRIDTELSGGDQVEIIHVQDLQIKPDWMKKAITGKAQSKIAHQLRRMNREKVYAGEVIIFDFLENRDFPKSISLIDRLQSFYGFPTRDELCIAVAENRVTLGTGAVNFLRGRKRKKSLRNFFGLGETEEEKRAATPKTVQGIDPKKTFYINNVNVKECAFCEHCHPIPGDEIIGYLTPDKTLEVHRRDCPIANSRKTQDGKHLIATAWDLHRNLRFPCKIYVKGIDRRGIIRALTDLLEENNVSAELQGINITAKDGVFEGELLFSMFDTEETMSICNLLLTLSDINIARRKAVPPNPGL